MSAYYADSERQEWFRDEDGVPSRIQHRDEVRLATIDWTGASGYSGTISTSTWESGGVTLSGSSTSGDTTYTTVTGTGGWARNTMTDSNSRIFVRDLRFYAPASGRNTDDYGN